MCFLFILVIFSGHCIENSTCLCDANYFGETCSSRIYSFGQNSILHSSLKKQLSSLSFLIITKEPVRLSLLYFSFELVFSTEFYSILDPKKATVP